MDNERACSRSGFRRARQATVVAIVLAAFFAGFGQRADAATGNFTVTMTNRENVRQFWYSTFQASEGVPAGFTGNVGSCTPGGTSQAYRDATLTRINWFRAMAGVPSDITFTSSNNAKAQAAALIMSAKGELSHQPPSNWPCWTQAGYDGADNSNLALGNSGATAITQFMEDAGTNNTVAGHRRNMLSPNVIEMGSGSIPPGAGTPAEAQYIGNFSSTARIPRDTFVAWPPAGFVPYQTVFARWSFVLPTAAYSSADFSNATVTMSGSGVTAQPTIVNRGSFAGPGIVFVPNNMGDGADWPKPANDQPITVTIGNVKVNNVPQNFTYTTTIFDPADADPSHTPLTITGTASPPVGQATTYSVNQIPNATGYQWRTTRLSSFALTDAAEAGLTNWDAAVPSGYNPISTAQAASPTRSFQLNLGSSAGQGESKSLTLKNTLVPTASSQISFKTKAHWLQATEAVLEVSNDGGSNWTPLYTDTGFQDTGFTTRTVSLGSYANQHVKLRLRASYDFDSGLGYYIGNDLGWFVDDITFTNFLSADAPVLSGPTASRDFSFTPQTGQYDLAVRANFAGSGFGAWSATKRLTPTTAISLAAALDHATLPFTSSAPAWTGQSAVTHDGVDAGRSAPIGNSATTSFSTTVTGPTKLRFWWKSDTQAGDVLSVTVDGAAPFAGISGNVDWVQKTIDIASGQHTVRWTYTKNASGTAGADAVWVDEVTTASK